MRLCSHTLQSITLFACALDTLVLADAGAPAYRAHAPFAVMFAHVRSATLLALALLTVVGADAGATAYLARPFSVMLAYLRSVTLLALALVDGSNAGMRA